MDIKNYKPTLLDIAQFIGFNKGSMDRGDVDPSSIGNKDLVNKNKTRHVSSRESQFGGSSFSYVTGSIHSRPNLGSSRGGFTDNPAFDGRSTRVGGSDAGSSRKGFYESETDLSQFEVKNPEYGNIPVGKIPERPKKLVRKSVVSGKLGGFRPPPPVRTPFIENRARIFDEPLIDYDDDNDDTASIDDTVVGGESVGGFDLNDMKELLNFFQSTPDLSEDDKIKMGKLKTTIAQMEGKLNKRIAKKAQADEFARKKQERADKKQERADKKLALANQPKDTKTVRKSRALAKKEEADQKKIISEQLADVSRLAREERAKAKGTKVKTQAKGKAKGTKEKTQAKGKGGVVKSVIAKK